MRITKYYLQLSLSNDADVSAQLTSRHRDQLQQDAGAEEEVLPPARPAKPFKHRLRKNKIVLANSINNIDDSVGDDGCNNPFDCPPKFRAAGRRPRVKSNLRARKRNFWQKNKGSNLANREFGVGHGVRRGRKIRRGRKQRPEVSIQNQSSAVNDERENLIEESVDIKAATEQFIPTTRTTTTSDRKEEISAPAVEEEENEIFDDFFDHQNDFFAASSTVSPVVFKGSPGPGFFSSPRPFYDDGGHQVGTRSRDRDAASNNFLFSLMLRVAFHCSLRVKRHAERRQLIW